MKIHNLQVTKNKSHILRDISVEFPKGKIHTIMGKNGCGKTTLSYTIAGHPDCQVENGEIFYKDINILDLSIEERSLQGIFLAPQYPSVIDGLSHAMFLKEALNTKRKFLQLEEFDEFEFLKILKEKAEIFQFNPKNYIRHSLNFGFSGGEKKRNEILQISLLEPDFIILDEIDSGLDIDSMKHIAHFLKSYISSERTIIVISHNPQFIQLLNSNSIYIMENGSFVEQGDHKIIELVLQKGLNLTSWK